MIASGKGSSCLGFATECYDPDNIAGTRIGTLDGRGCKSQVLAFAIECDALGSDFLRHDQEGRSKEILELPENKVGETR